MDVREPNRLPYLAPLDGIRAIAILAVLVFHVWPPALKGGFTGVDVFFVLSGFLITSIVLHDIRAGRFSLKEFYLRRIQRLLPNVIVTVLAVLLLWTFLMPPNAAVQPGIHGLWTLFNLSNIYIWKNLGSYWSNAAEWAPLTHFWSLGIEEQFYLLFPTSLLFLARFQSKRVWHWLTLATIASFGLCWYGSHAFSLATFYLLPTRVWELLLGAILAAWRTPLQGERARTNIPLNTSTREFIGWTGIVLIVAGFLLIDEHYEFPGLVALLPTGGTVLVLFSVAEGSTRLSRFLSTPIMVGTGKLSYSLYLWHWPLIIFGKLQAELYGFPQFVGAIFGGCGSLIIAWLAYIGVERPFRNRGPGRSRRLAAITAGFILVVLACGLVAVRRASVDPNQLFNQPAFYGKLFDAGRAADPNMATAIRYSDIYFPPIPPHPDDTWRTGGIIKLYGAAYPQVVVLGSSHALMYSRVINDICQKMDLSVAFFGVDAVTPAFFETTVNRNFSTPEEAHEFDDARRKWLKEWQPEIVFVIDRWDARITTSANFEAKLRDFLREVSPLTQRVVFVTQAPVAQVSKSLNLRAFATWSLNAQHRLPRLVPDANEPLRKQTTAIAEAALSDFPNLRVLRADLPFYQVDGSIRYAAGRNFFYVDGDHLTDSGAEEVRANLEKALEEIRVTPSLRQESCPTPD